MLLAVPPTLVAMGTLLAVGAVAGPPVLVVPVVTSAFLLYRVPTDPMNDLGVLAPAHVTGLALGVGAALLVQPGALAAALALGATLLLLGVADHRHPAAPVTALVFASVARPEQAVGVVLFLLALALLTALVPLQRAASSAVRRRMAPPEA